MKKLQILNAEDCRIDSKELNNLINLHVFYNRGITNINHLKKLQILNAEDCGIDSKELTSLTKIISM